MTLSVNQAATPTPPPASHSQLHPDLRIRIAALPETEARAVLSRSELKANTPNTKTDPEELMPPPEAHKPLTHSQKELLQLKKEKNLGEQDTPFGWPKKN
jgi:hypothetical protein